MYHSLHLQQAKVRHILRSLTFQPKLTIGQPNDIYEQEADRVAEQVMRMPEPRLQRQVEPEEEEEEEETLQPKPLAEQITPLVQVQRQEEPEEEEEELQAKPLSEQITPLVQRQVEPEEEEEEEEEEEPIQAKLADDMQVQRQEEPEEEEPIQTKQVSTRAPSVTPNLASRIQSLKGGGQPLSESTRAFFEPRFGHDFSQVRLHTDTKAAESARAVNARAYTVGRDIVFGVGQYLPRTTAGKRLLAHELTHVVQQASGNIVQRIRNETPNITRLWEHLRDDQEDAAIGLMGRLSASEVQDVLASREFKELAISAFNNDEMYRGIRAMHGDLYPSLQWMFDEGTDWGKVKNIIRRAGDWELIKAKITASGVTEAQKKQVRENPDMKKYFVKELNDEQMAEAVDLLGGTLLWKFSWMYAEGVGDWELIKAKITASGVTEAQKKQVRKNPDMKKYFVKELGDWELIKAKITASGVTEAQKKQVRENPDMKKYFVKELNKKEIWVAVNLLGGDRKWIEEKGIFEDCTAAQEKQILVAHPRSRIMLANAITLLSAPSLASKVTTALNYHFKSHKNFVVNQVKATFQRIRGKLPYVTYECEQSNTGMCTTAGAYTWWIFGDIHLCPRFFQMSLRTQATTIIHEGAHLFCWKLDLGYAHEKGYVNHSTFRALLNADPYAELVNQIF
jgi:outer membrane biosynthesis protein TonB